MQPLQVGRQAPGGRWSILYTRGLPASTTVSGAEMAGDTLTQPSDDRDMHARTLLHVQLGARLKRLPVVYALATESSCPIWYDSRLHTFANPSTGALWQTARATYARPLCPDCDFRVLFAS